MTLSPQLPDRITPFPTTPITATARPELRAVFAKGPEGLTMRWTLTPRERGTVEPTAINPRTSVDMLEAAG